MDYLDWRTIPSEEQGTTEEIRATKDVKSIHGKEPIDVKENYLNYTLKFIGITALAMYIAGGFFSDAWTPKQIKEYNRGGWINRKLEYAKTYEDSLKVYKKFNIPIIFQAPLIKEEADIKQNDLEKSAKEFY